jgi:inhibitor of cysteine peptidase
MFSPYRLRFGGILLQILGLTLALTEMHTVAALERKYIVVHEKDNRAELRMRSSQTLIVDLVSQPGTGYTWKIFRFDETLWKSNRLDASDIKELVKGHVLRERVQSGLPGSEEEQVFQFVPKMQGSTEIEIRYVRPWEPAVPARAFKLRVELTN